MVNTSVIVLPFPLVLLFWYAIICSLETLNYSLWVRFENPNDVSTGIQNTYIAFCVIGLVTYALIGGPMFVHGYKYSPTQKARDKKIRIGIVVMYFASTFPMFILELVIIWEVGVAYVLQGICFFLQFIGWGIGSFAVWFIYMWQVAKLYHVYRLGGGRPNIMSVPSAYQTRFFGINTGDPISPDSLRPPIQLSSAARRGTGQPDVI